MANAAFINNASSSPLPEPRSARARARKHCSGKIPERALRIVYSKIELEFITSASRWIWPCGEGAEWPKTRVCW